MDSKLFYHVNYVNSMIATLENNVANTGTASPDGKTINKIVYHLKKIHYLTQHNSSLKTDELRQWADSFDKRGDEIGTIMRKCNNVINVQTAAEKDIVNSAL